MTQDLEDIVSGNGAGGQPYPSLSHKHNGFAYYKVVGSGNSIVVHKGYDDFNGTPIPSGRWPGDLSFITVQASGAGHIRIVAVVYDVTDSHIDTVITLYDEALVEKTADSVFVLSDSFKHDGFPFIEPFQSIGVDGHSNITFSAIEFVNDLEGNNTMFLIPWFKSMV